MVRTDGRGREIQWRLPTPKEVKKPLAIPILTPLEMITRAEWAAAPRVEQDNDIRLTLPVMHIRYTFTNTDECATEAECIPFLRQLQTDSQEKGFPDLMYNFLIGSDGMLYEGRGFDWKCTVFADPWVNTPGESINVAYIGRFRNVEAPSPFLLTSKIMRKWMFDNRLLDGRFEITPSICWPEDFEAPSAGAEASAKSLDVDITLDAMEFTENPDSPLSNPSEEAVGAENNPSEALD